VDAHRGVDLQEAAVAPYCLHLLVESNSMLDRLWL
jgi:hypothetical protein